MGDIIDLKQGDHIPADCLVLESDDLKCDESGITGESDHIKKGVAGGKVNNPFLLNDATIVLGKGTALVCAIGLMTQTGEVEEKLFDDNDEGTPLQQKLERVANFIGKIGMYIALLTFLAMVINLIIGRILSNQEVMSYVVVKGIINACIVAITIIVVAVPEGLPLAVTISLAYSVN